jgi:hypothetical protein
MIRTSLRLLVAGSSALALLMASAPIATAQVGGAVVVRDMRRLGGSTAFYRPALTNVAALKRMSDDARAVAGLRSVLEQAGLTSITDEVMAAFAGAGTAYSGVACAEATPAVGTIVECDVQPGQTIQWMAYRPKGGAPALLQNMRWAGRQPFPAYLFRVTEGDRTYTFVVPKECGNLSLLRTEERPRAAAVVPPVVAPPPPPPPPAPVVVPPPPPPEPVSEQTGFQPGPAPVVVSSPLFFADGLFGKERRVRAIDGEIEAAQCTPLAGVKFGIAKRFENDWEVAGAVGLALSLVSDDDKVREHALFVDVEANKYIGKAFVGVGLSLWDFTRSETVTPAALVHVGLPLTPNARIPLYFLVEGRLFFDGADDIANNYHFWGGVRVRF